MTFVQRNAAGLQRVRRRGATVVGQCTEVDRGYVDVELIARRRCDRRIATRRSELTDDVVAIAREGAVEIGNVRAAIARNNSVAKAGGPCISDAAGFREVAAAVSDDRAVLDRSRSALDADRAGVECSAVSADRAVGHVERAAGHPDRSPVSVRRVRAGDGDVLEIERSAVDLDPTAPIVRRTVLDPHVLDGHGCTGMDVEDAIHGRAIDGAADAIDGDIRGDVQIAGESRVFIRARERKGHRHRRQKNDRVVAVSRSTLRIGGGIGVRIDHRFPQRAVIDGRRACKAVLRAFHLQDVCTRGSCRQSGDNDNQQSAVKTHCGNLRKLDRYGGDSLHD